MQSALLIILFLLAICLLCSYKHEQVGGTVPDPEPVPVPPAVGLNVESYHTNAQGQPLELIRRSVLNQDINFEWQSGPILDTGLTDDVMLIINGYLKPRVSGRYKFFIESDDGVTLAINGVQVINEWKVQAAAWSSTDFIELDSTRFHSFELRWYEHSGDATLKLYWEGTTADGESIVGHSVVPIDVFYQTLPATEALSAPKSAQTEAPTAPTQAQAQETEAPTQAQAQIQVLPVTNQQTTNHVTTEQLIPEVEDKIIDGKIAANVQALKEIRDRLDLVGSINRSDESIVRRVNDRVQRAEIEINNQLTEVRNQQDALELKLTRMLETQQSMTGDGPVFNETILTGHEQRLNGIESKLFNIKGGLTEVKMILRDITSKLDNGYRCQLSNTLCR